MVVGGSNDGGSSATDPRVSKRDYNRTVSNDAAQRSAGWYSRDAYMSEVGKEGVKRQQEAMRDQADDEDARVQRRQTPTRTPAKRTPPRTAGRK